MTDENIPGSQDFAECRRSHGDVVLHGLQGPAAAIWEKVWLVAVSDVLTEFALSHFDLRTGRALPGLLRLDDPAARAELVFQIARPQIATKALEGLLECKQSLNDVLQSERRSAQSAGQLRTALVGAAVVDSLIKQPTSEAIVAAYDLSMLWPRVAKRIAQEVFQDEKTTPPEWLQWNRLLLAHFFNRCRLRRAHQVMGQLNELSSSFNDLRGGQVALIERVSKDGIVDQPIAQAAPSQTTFAQFGGYHNDLLRAVAIGTQKWLSGRGVIHDLIQWPEQSTLQVPARLQAVLSTSAYHAYRGQLLSQFEATLVSYGALSSIEQLLRAIAAHAGVTHLKAAGYPAPVAEWIQDPNLGLPDDLRNEILALYDNDRGNLRNRAMHGSLLETASKQLEAALAVQNDALPDVFLDVSSDSAMPSQMARYFVGVLGRTQTHAATRALCSSDLDWTIPLWMSPDDRALGEELCRDVERDIPGALVTGKLVSEFIATSLPIFVKHGLFARYGQYQACSLDAHLLLFLSWGVLFEGLYRLVAHVDDASVLQRSKRADGQRQFQYRMLDSRPDGLCTERILESLTAHLPSGAQESATKCLLIAVKLRNALSHGAVPCYGVAEHRAAGHLLAKASRILVEAARHKMTQVSAYYLRQRRNESSNSALDDWLDAERAIAAQFEEALARRFTLPSGEVLIPEN